MDLSGVLRRLASGRDEALALARRVGEKYTELARTVPEFFERGLEPARGSADEAALKYGHELMPTTNRIDWESGDPWPPSPGRRVIVTPREGSSAFMDVEPGWYVRQHGPWLQGLPREAGELFKGDEPWGRPFLAGLFQGSGMGSMAYPALYDIARQRGARVYSDPLTSVNQFRQSLAQNAATLRHYPDTFILAHEDQLRGTGVNPLELANLSPEEQVGMLLGSAAVQGNRYYRASPLRMALAKRNLDSTNPKMAEDYQELLATGINPYTGNWGPLTAQSPLSEFQKLTQKLREHNASAFGDRFLRKLAIIEHLSAGRPVTDINPELLRHLEYSAGGPARP